MYNIQKDIPKPESRSSKGVYDHFTGGRRLKYPWHIMEVGDSIEIEHKDFKSARGSAVTYGERHGKVFEYVTNPGVRNGGRIWRTA